MTRARKRSERSRWVLITRISGPPTDESLRRAESAINAIQKIGRVVRAETDGYGEIRFLARRGR